MFKSNFKSLIHDEMPNDALRLSALRELLTETVRNSVADALYDPSQYPVALRRLEEEYGHPFIVAQAHVNSLLKLPTVRSNDATGLRAFSNALHGAVSALANSSHHYELASSGTLKQVLDKLPSHLKAKWGLKVYDMQPLAPTILDFDTWIKRLSKSQEFSMAIEDGVETPTVVKKTSGKPLRPHIPTISAVDVVDQPEATEK